MSFLDNIKKLTQPFDDEDGFYDEDEMETPIPVNDEAQDDTARQGSFFSAEEKPARASRRSASREAARVVDLGATSQPLKVVLVRPETFEAAAEIADQLRERRPVLMNLENTPKDVARRLIDFLSGVAYALEGKIKRAASNAYIITPYNVDIMGADEGETEASELYF